MLRERVVQSEILHERIDAPATVEETRKVALHDLVKRMTPPGSR